MKLRINKDGHLEIFRKSEWSKVMCPFHQQDRYCGQWCALFSEPMSENLYARGPSVQLALCQRRTYTVDPEDFEDLRR